MEAREEEERLHFTSNRVRHSIAHIPRFVELHSRTPNRLSFTANLATPFSQAPASVIPNHERMECV